jgi:hypothetical protein
MVLLSLCEVIHVFVCKGKKTAVIIVKILGAAIKNTGPWAT